jgi:hypothetical protein
MKLWYGTNPDNFDRLNWSADISSAKGGQDAYAPKAFCSAESAQ